MCAPYCLCVWQQCKAEAKTQEDSSSIAEAMFVYQDGEGLSLVGCFLMMITLKVFIDRVTVGGCFVRLWWYLQLFFAMMLL